MNIDERSNVHPVWSSLSGFDPRWSKFEPEQLNWLKNMGKSVRSWKAIKFCYDKNISRRTRKTKYFRMILSTLYTYYMYVHERGTGGLSSSNSWKMVACMIKLGGFIYVSQVPSGSAFRQSAQLPHKLFGRHHRLNFSSM